ncbi:MAG: hypothetical protein AAGA28_01495 [Pseudomonadota bacterium]
MTGFIRAKTSPRVYSLRADLHQDALSLMCLIETAMSMPREQDVPDQLGILDMAYDRASELTNCLDSTSFDQENDPEQATTAETTEETVAEQSETRCHLDRINELEHKLGHISNLVTSLQCVAWDLCGQTFRDGHHAKLRDAVVGLGHSLEAAVEAAFKDDSTSSQTTTAET